MKPQPKTAQLDLPSGTTLGKYEILRKLATGGMAEIYLARSRGNAGFEKLVVLKRILPTVASDPMFVQMFMDEARLAATLQHTNIADVYDVGEEDGSPFFAMEFIHGQDVRAIKMEARKRNEPIPLAISLAIIHGTASALDYAHERTGQDGKVMGLVHRDVSTSNVLVSYDGAIKLVDFGIARAAGRTQQTQVGTLKGKIPYMSPEQCRGGSLDRRSDLFSLGVVMFELTVGRRPFRGETDFAIMDQIVYQGAPTPSSIVRGYPPELEAIVMKLLARKQEDRYQTAEAMLHDLDPFLAAHRLWVSPKPLSKYMRTIFASRIASWENAEKEGVAFATHVISTVTSQSGTSELHTPPSAFPGLMPLSQEMPAVRSAEIPAQGDGAAQSMELDAAKTMAAVRSSQPVFVPATPDAVVDMPSRPTAYPELRPSRKRLLFVLVAVIGVAAGFGVMVLMQPGDKPKDAAKAVDDQKVVMPVDDDKPETTPETTTPETTKPDTTKPDTTKPETTKPDTTKPDTTKPDEPSGSGSGSATETVKKPPPNTTIKKPPPNTTIKKPPPNTTIKKPPPDTTKPPKEPEWDPNSPFLPPKS